MSVEDSDFVPTRCSTSISKPADFKVCVYKERQRKSEKTEKIDTFKKRPAKEPEAFDMKKARHEVIKFGISEFDPQKKEEAKVNLAIKLGAKPDKKKYINYKKLQEERKLLKKAEKERLDLQQLGKTEFGDSNAKGKFSYSNHRKTKGSLLQSYGKPTLKIKNKIPKK